MALANFKKLLSNTKKTSAKNSNIRDILVENRADFIPYACYIDDETIVTKNGELLQTIAIKGFDRKKNNSELADLRETIQDSLRTHIPNKSFALWVHNIRTKQDFSSQAQYEEYFPHYVNEGWKAINKWDEQYSNSIYITIVVSGYSKQDKKTNNSKIDQESKTVPKTFGLYMKKIDQPHKALIKLSNKILESLADHGAYKLKIHQEDGISYSQHMKLFSHIINFIEKPQILEKRDLSELIANNNISFHNRSIEVKNEGKKYHSAIFSVKHHAEIGTHFLDNFLQLPQEFIVTHSLDFIPQEQAVSDFEYQHHIFDISGR